jgi:predicted transcriptional regulator
LEWRVYARFDTADQKKHQKVFEKLKARKDIYWIAQLGGRYDILFAIQAKSLVHFSDILSEIQKQFPFVTNSQFAIRTQATQFQRSYLLERETSRIEGGFKVSDEIIELNENEKNIIRQLVENPRIQVLELAKKVKVSRITANTIIKKLEKIGIIQHTLP